MPDNTETLVYINAPTLDNADECTFIRNNDFLYATTGDTERGDTANLVLYEKLIEKDCYDPLSAPDVPRNTFNPGRWAANGTEASSAGDYFIGNGVQVTAKAFNIGKLTKLKFRFFEKGSIDDESQRLITAKNLEDCTTPEEIIAALSNKEKNPGFVPKIAIFAPHFNNNYNDGYTYITDAIIDTETLPTEEDDWFAYIPENDFYVTAEMTKSLKCGIAFVFYTNEYDWEGVFEKNAFYTLQGNSNSIRNKATNISDKRICARSVPRGALDNVSYIIGDTTNTNIGISSGQNRLIEFAYCMEIDLVNEYLKDNSDNHHLDLLDVQDINQLRYSAPHVQTEDYDIKLGAAHECFISHESVTRNNAINCERKKIHSVTVPFKYSSDENDYVVSAMKGNHFSTPYGGLLHTNRQILVTTDVDENGEPINWVRSENIIAYSYFEENMLYTFTFSTPIIYKNNGVFIKAAIALDANGNEESGKNTIGIKVSKKGDDFYSFSPDDYVKFTNSPNTKIRCTANINILFDYSLRKEWFDYVEKIESDIETNNTYITEINNNITEINNDITEINNLYNEHIDETHLTTVKTYESFLEDRITFSWLELCTNHATPLSGILDSVTVYMSDNQWTAYEDAAYLCIYEKNEDNIFVKKAVSTNSLTPRRGVPEKWKFDNVELSGKHLRVGLLSTPEDSFGELGTNPQPNVSLQTNAITNNTGWDGECYICNNKGARVNLSAPMDFHLDRFGTIENDIENIENNINNINQNINNIEGDVENIENEILNIQNNFNSFTDALSKQINIGKWRIYINEEGNLIIDTEAMAAAGKSIIFKEIV